ncbi:hypothetical protein [Thiocystis violascens]|uniref:hypothetical protein n=1 Tax=Thiocystis violascens TaxID=73141 RepID=UPI00022C460C|nr:hypothetical protein [Thiocystis violascens]
MPFGAFEIIGEYVSTTDDFDLDSLGFEDEGARLSAWNIEAGFTFPVMRCESVAAVAYQGTRETLALDFLKSAGCSTGRSEIFDRTSLSLEWARDIDYSNPMAAPASPPIRSQLRSPSRSNPNRWYPAARPLGSDAGGQPHWSSHSRYVRGCRQK